MMIISIHGWRITFQANRYVFFFCEKYILVPTFSGYSYFSPYILFLPLLVPIMKNASHFGPYRYIRNEKS